MIFSLILSILVTNNVYAIEFFPLVATNAEGVKTHQGFVGKPIIFQHTTANKDSESLDFELLFTIRLPDDTIVDKKSIPVHLQPNETKTLTYQFVPAKEGNFVTTVFTELYVLADSIAFPVLDDSKNYKKEIVMIHTFPFEKNCSRVCTNPSELTVNVGTVVEWLNASPSDQTISTGIYHEDEKGTSFTYDNKFQSRIAPDSKFSYLFLEPSDYKYYFSEHRFLQFAGIIHALPASQPLPQEPLEKPRIPSPLKQFKSGISFSEIKCKENLQIIPKHNGNPACVKSTTVQKLIQRGWVMLTSPPGEIPFGIEIPKPKNLTMEVVSADWCSGLILDKIPPNGLTKRKDWGGPSASIIKIGQVELSHAPHLKEMINEMNNSTGFKAHQFDENVIVKQISGSGIDHSKISDWLKENFEKQYTTRGDGAFGSFFQYNRDIYAIRFMQC